MIVQSTFLLVKLFIIVGVHLEVVEGKLLLDTLLESLALLGGQGIGLGNDGNDVDNIRQLLQDDNINGLQGVSRGLDEEQTAVNTSVLDVAITLGSQLLAQVGRVLILDVFDNGVPASVVVDEISVSRGIDNVHLEADAVLLDDVGNGVDLGGLADGLIGLETTLGFEKVGGEDGVDQGRLAQTSLSYIEGVQR